MTDKQFQQQLNKLHDLHQKYHDQLRFVEEEFFRRFGVYPGDVDCDSFIDSYHINPNNMTVQEIHTDMEEILQRLGINRGDDE